jgi:hypothetical protein
MFNEGENNIGAFWTNMMNLVLKDKHMEKNFEKTRDLNDQLNNMLFIDRDAFMNRHKALRIEQTSTKRIKKRHTII